MTPELFDMLLESYGADLSRWPEEHQSAAGHYLRSSPLARQAVERMTVLDQLIQDAAPAVSRQREDSLSRSVMAQLEKMPLQAPSWITWDWAHGGLTYAGLFVLGGLGNLLTRFLTQDSPMDFLFSSNLLSPFGG